MRGNEPPAGPPHGLSRRRLLQAAGLAGLTGLAGQAAGGGAQSDRMHWQFETGDWVTASPTVVGETVYAGSHNGALYALDAATGRQAWAFETETPVERAPVVQPAADSPFEGTAVFVPDQQRVHGVDESNAAKRWETELVEETSSPVLADDDLLFYGDKLNRVRTTDGKREWISLELKMRLDLDEGYLYTRSPPATQVDGTIYAGTVYGEVVAVSPETGDGEWGYVNRHPVLTAPTVSDGLVLVGDNDGVFRAVEEGREAWTFSESDDSINSSPTVHDGTVYFGCQDRHVYALDAATGEEQWRFETGGGVRSSPTVAGDAVFVGSSDGTVYALDAATGEERWQFETDGGVRSSPTVVDGVVYVGSLDGSLYALDAGVSGSSTGTRIDQGVLGHHHSHVDGDEQSVDPVDGPVTRTPVGGKESGGVTGYSSSGDEGAGFGIGAALAGLGAGVAWARRRRDEE